MASKLVSGVEKPGAKRVSFQECLRKVSRKCQDGISLLVKGKEPKVPKSPSLQHNRGFLYKYQISPSNLPNKYYGRTMMRSFYFRGGGATAVAMRQL